MEFISEFYRFCRTRRKIWLLQVFITFGLMAGVFVLSERSAIAPYYPMPQSTSVLWE